MPYNSFKSHKKLGFHPLFRRYNFQKATGGGQIDPKVELRQEFTRFPVITS